MTSTYPFEPTPQWTTINPRSFLPFRTRAGDLETHPLPSPPRNRLFNDNYAVTTHFVPAACPRLTPDIPLPVVPKLSTNSTERKQGIQQLVAKIVERQERFVQGGLGEERSEKPLWNCVNRYVKRVQDGRKGLTLFFAHANGFPKEIWETTLRYLLSSSTASLIDEVWSWEAVQHGDAALINESNLSGIFDWQDNARDIAHFLLHYLPEDASLQASLPAHLHPLLESISESRKTNGFSSRSLVTVGHSLRGCSLILAAVDFPALFPSIVLVDPVAIQPGSSLDLLRNTLAVTIGRRERWSSREEAWNLLRASPFFRAWHPDTLQLYVTYGLCEDSQGGVKLKMSGLHEALATVDRIAPNEAWELLEKVDERIELRWIVPGKAEDKGVMGEEATRVRVWRRPANSSNVVIHSAGHLIAQESPEELAQEISAFLERKYRLRSRAHL
ncbi:Alpha/beta hydrolase family-domain-containing protein [Suillus clintonianus]|uniref:Alpha/beta hydrolase family-domain-containing protein n=1 Tax=Suillus clintonianus TaxID=1904413 RepID=UPI001B85EB81|nr:Alpha/beta hydrolase family-domain-containing protein [Suillus clintonianus]KAG2126603.1 Alpha/beta hydrolase family-domain-containing protein [Suillus clintonianus]